MTALFSLWVRLLRLFGNLIGFFVEVAGPLPLPALFFGSFLTHAGTLPFAFLAANVLEGLWVFFLARPHVLPFFLVHRSPSCLLLRQQDYTLRLQPAMSRLQGVESVTFYDTAATGAGELHRFETVLSTVNLVWLEGCAKELT
jgi:hypothetical protein